MRVGMEASGHARWFERLLAELNFELWIGDAAVIRAKRVRKQKTDRQDAQHMFAGCDRRDGWVGLWESLSTSWASFSGLGYHQGSSPKSRDGLADRAVWEHNL